MTDTTVEIAPATAADLDDIARLERECFPTPWRRHFFETELTAEGRFLRVARDARGELVGYLFAMHLLDEMHVNKIAVHERCRRRGVAATMMDHCIRFARANSIRFISLEVRESNAAAQRFYESLDFRPVYKRIRYYPDGESAIVMTTELKKTSEFRIQKDQ